MQLLQYSELIHEWFSNNTISKKGGVVLQGINNVFVFFMSLNTMASGSFIFSRYYCHDESVYPLIQEIQS